MLHSLDDVMINPPLYGVDYSAGTRIQARTRAANRAQTAEVRATDQHISDGLRTWELMLERVTASLPTAQDLAGEQTTLSTRLGHGLREHEAAIARSMSFLPTTTEALAARDNFSAHLAGRLHALQIALHCSTQFLGEFQAVQ